MSPTPREKIKPLPGKTDICCLRGRSGPQNPVVCITFKYVNGFVSTLVTRYDWLFWHKSGQAYKLND